MKNRDSGLNRWIFESFTITPEGLGLLRILTALMLLFFLIPGGGTVHYHFLATLPADFYAPPPGPMMLFDTFPGLAIFQVLQTVAVLSALMILVGYHTKWVSLITGLSVLILQGFIFSVGKIDHEILVAVVPVILAYSNWGAAFSIDSFRKGKDQKNERWPLTLLALLIGFMMFTAGFPKILGGWLDISTQAAQSHLLNQFYVRERQDLLAELAVQWNNPFFWELLDWGTVLFEVGFLISIFRAAWFRFFVGIAVLFHFSTMISMNIAFLPNFIAYAVFLNWDAIYKSSHQWMMRWNRNNFRKSRKGVLISFTLMLVVFFALLNYITVHEKVITLQSDLMLYEVVLVSMAVVILLVGGVKCLGRSPRGFGTANSSSLHPLPPEPCNSN